MDGPLRIVNVVATANINQAIDLERLANEGGFRYDLAIYPCAYLKDHLTKGKVSIFASGKLISIGTKNPRDASADLRHAVEKLVELGLAKIVRISPRIQNMVARRQLEHAVDLEELAKDVRMIYEPGQWPAAMYWPKKLPGTVVSIFATGKVVFSGLKSIGDMKKADLILDEILPTYYTKERVKVASAEQTSAPRPTS